MSSSDSSKVISLVWAERLQVLSLGLPLLLAWVGFADLGGYPSNDDPFYGRPAKVMAEESRFTVVRQAGELSASSAAHVAIGGALAWTCGFSYRVLYLAVILQLWLASLLIYAISREVHCSHTGGLLWASIFLFNPLCCGHGFTFMTDGPAMCWGVMAIYCFGRGLRRNTSMWFWFGSLSIGVAFWMRQTHVLLAGYPLASLGVLCLVGKLNKTIFFHALATVVPAALAIGLFESGWIVIGDQARVHTVAPTQLDVRQTITNLYGLCILLGFLLLPAFPMVLARLRRRRTVDSQSQKLPAQPTRFDWPIWMAGLATAILMTPLVATQGRACLTSATGTFIQNAHLGPIFLSDFEQPERWGDMGGVTWPNGIWTLLTLAAILNCGALLAVCLQWVHRNFGMTNIRQHHVGLTSVCGLLFSALPIVVVILSVRTGVLDRYWMLLLPIVFAVIPEIIGDIRAPAATTTFTSRLVRWSCVGLLVAQIVFSLVMVRDFLAWNQLRWQQVQSWLEEGLRPQDIDGGRDINAWYRSAEDPETMPRAGDNSQWWSGHAKVALSIGPRPGWQESGRLRWRAWMTAEEHEILLLRKVEKTNMDSVEKAN